MSLLNVKRNLLLFLITLIASFLKEISNTTDLLTNPKSKSCNYLII